MSLEPFGNRLMPSRRQEDMEDDRSDIRHEHKNFHVSQQWRTSTLILNVSPRFCYMKGLDKQKELQEVGKMFTRESAKGGPNTMTIVSDKRALEEPPVFGDSSSHVEGPRSWTKGSSVGVGSCGTVYKAVDSKGTVFAVKEVCIVEHDREAQQALTQLKQNKLSVGDSFYVIHTSQFGRCDDEIDYLQMKHENGHRVMFMGSVVVMPSSKLKEVEILKKFKHPNIVQYLGTDQVADKLYIFLEFFERGSLVTVYKKSKLVASQVSRCTRDILSGLKYIHDQNIVHRDIKCANILVDEAGVCKLADFGTAKQFSDLDPVKSFVGSAYWMAPEVINPDKTYGLPADIWSLGCSVLEMSTRAPPFGKMEPFQAMFTVGHEVAPPIPDTLSDSLRDFVKGCLEIEPKNRPTATELLQHPFITRHREDLANSSLPRRPHSATNLQLMINEPSSDISSQQRLDMERSLVSCTFPVYNKGPKFPWTKGSRHSAGQNLEDIYCAVDSDGMLFAVKEVPKIEQEELSLLALAQLKQEVEILKQFKHPNIVQYWGTDQVADKLYIFLEWVGYGPLARVYKNFELADTQISNYTRDILRGLEYLHDQNVMHRDIKCENILVGSNGTCKLSNFGYAKQLSSLDQTKSCVGSPYWMAPEVINPSKTYGLPADIWSVGCSVLEMVTRTPPFGDMEWCGAMFTVGKGNSPPIPDNLSDSLRDFVKSCLEIQPEQRPTAKELLQHPFITQGKPSLVSDRPREGVKVNHARSDSISVGVWLPEDSPLRLTTQVRTANLERPIEHARTNPLTVCQVQDIQTTAAIAPPARPSDSNTSALLTNWHTKVEEGGQSRRSSSIGSLTLKPPPRMTVSSIGPMLSTAEMIRSLGPDAAKAFQWNSSDSEGEEEDSIEPSLAASSSVQNEESVVSHFSNRAGTSRSGNQAEEVNREPVEKSDNELLVRELGKKVTVETASAGPRTVNRSDSEKPWVSSTSTDIKGPKFPWKKGSVLRRGICGTVYSAIDSGGMFFAAKEVSTVEESTGALEALALLKKEAAILKKLRHANIVQYLGTDQVADHLYIFLESFECGSLATMYKNFVLVDSQISRYVRDVLKGLKYLHDRNIVHRDIKCANILVANNGTCKLAAFGMAKQLSSLGRTKSCMGSAYWMAPEVIDKAKTYGLPADIWSLGCSVLEMATGGPPFEKLEWGRAMSTVRRGNAPPVPDTLSNSLQDFIKGCLRIKPKKRPTVKELLRHPFIMQGSDASSNFDEGDGVSSNSDEGSEASSANSGEGSWLSENSDEASSWVSGSSTPQPTLARLWGFRKNSPAHSRMSNKRR